MARSRRLSRRRKTRAKRPVKAAYQAGLVEAIRKYLPGQFFSQWSVRGGTVWTPQRLVWMALLLVWGVDQTLDARFTAMRQVLRSLFPKWPLGTSYTGWNAAQMRWLERLRPGVTKRLQGQMQQVAGRCWLREGWCAFAADGSRVECPRTAANEAGLGCAGKHKTGPQLFLTTLWHMGTGLPWAFRIGPGTASERRHLEAMLPELPRQALVVADAGFTGYDLYRRLLAAQMNFLLRVGANVQLLRKLGYVQERGDTVYLWPDERQSEPPIVLRLLRRRQGRKTMYLVTNVLEKERLSAASAGVLYEMRWGVEVFYRSLKQTLQKRKLLSRTPKAAEGELTWAVIGMWLLGLMSVAKIIARDGQPLSWSAALARDRVRQSLRLALAGRRDRALLRDLGRTVQDDYQRHGSKKARDWPHKKKEKPPGSPKILTATAQQRRAVKRLRARKAAA